jgi:hypothetical protein
MSKKISNLFLSTGSMRSGTTWLFKLLRNHPDLYFTNQKEIHFIYDYFSGERMQSIELPIWDREFLVNPSFREGLNIDEVTDKFRMIYKQGLLRINWSREWEYYHSLFSLRRNERWCGDMCNLTSHLSTNQLGEVKSEFDNVRVIYIVRDPLKRLWSHFTYDNVAHGPVKWDESLWTGELYDDWLNSRWINESFDYHTAIKNGFEVFGDNFRVWYYEDFVNNMAGCLRGLEDYLEIDHHDYSQKDLTTYINSSSRDEDMWISFRDHMMPIMNEQVSKLSKIIPVHSKWSNYEDPTKIHGRKTQV